jgi:hypothetical protein
MGSADLTPRRREGDAGLFEEIAPVHASHWSRVLRDAVDAVAYDDARPRARDEVTFEISDAIGAQFQETFGEHEGRDARLRELRHVGKPGSCFERRAKLRLDVRDFLEVDVDVRVLSLEGFNGGFHPGQPAPEGDRGGRAQRILDLFFGRGGGSCFVAAPASGAAG